MHYVYKFIDKEDNVIYIGKTKNIHNRIKQHKENGHLSKECYENIFKIEYTKLTNSHDMNFLEVAMIKDIKPKYNKVDNNDVSISFITNKRFFWEEYNDHPFVKTVQELEKSERLSYTQALEELIKGKAIGSFDYHGLIKFEGGKVFHKEMRLENSNIKCSKVIYSDWKVIYEKEEDIFWFLYHLRIGLDVKKNEAYYKPGYFERRYIYFMNQLREDREEMNRQQERGELL